MTFGQLSDMEQFTRRDYYDAYRNEHGDKTHNVLDYALRKELAEGNIIHVGRNQYTYSKAKRVYSYAYSEQARHAVDKIQNEFPSIDFRVFELTQLNAFVNHLFAHNTLFISIENDVIDYVFDTLRGEYPGRIMLKPKADEYYRYLVDDQIVIQRLPSESPKGLEEPWQSRLEKILVDITVDKLLSEIVSKGEYPSIFTQAFARYLIDTGAMMRYANRKGAGKKFRECLDRYTHVAMEG